MSYELYDDNRFLGSLATNSGLKYARESVMPTAGPNLYSLFLQGHTDNPQQAAAELAQVLSRKNFAPDVQKTLLNLHKMLRKATGVVVIE